MFVIFDTETTGFGEADIVELASIIILDNGERHQFRQLMKPEFPIHPKASEVHGISNEEVTNLPSSKKWDVEEFENFIEARKQLILNKFGYLVFKV